MFKTNRDVNKVEVELENERRKNTEKRERKLYDWKQNEQWQDEMGTNEKTRERMRETKENRKR